METSERTKRNLEFPEYKNERFAVVPALAMAVGSFRNGLTMAKVSSSIEHPSAHLLNSIKSQGCRPCIGGLNAVQVLVSASTA
jgi:hypothetical protein